MNKIASQMLDKMQDWVQENPDLVKTTLLTSGLGALAAAALTGKEGENERTKTRVKRRIKNALLGALAAGGSVGLLHYGIKNISNAKLKNAPTPEEKLNTAVEDAGDKIGDAILHPATLTGAGIVGTAKGLKRSWNLTDLHATNVLHTLDANKVKLFGNVPKDNTFTDKQPKLRKAVLLLKNKAHAGAIRDFVAKLDTSPINVNADTAKNTSKEVADDLAKLVSEKQNPRTLNKLEQLIAVTADPALKKDLIEAQQLLTAESGASNASLAKLQKLFNSHESALANLISDAPEAAQLTKEDFIKNLRRAGFDNPEGLPLSKWGVIGDKIKGLARRNWRAGAGAALAMGGTAGVGGLVKVLTNKD